MGRITAAQFIAGTIGVSIARQWYEDAAFNEARLAELAEVLARQDAFPYALDLDPIEQELFAGYAEWSTSYDGPNPLIATEEPVVLPILHRLAGPGVRALDAACGTGRHAGHLAERGCVTLGIDQSDAMLAVARAKVPAARFQRADIRRLPIADGSIDLAVVALALCHLATPGEAVEELARVLRPSGTLVITDPHPGSSFVGGQAFYGGIVPGRPLTWVRNHTHSAATWLRSFRHAGLEVVDCTEVPFSEAQMASSPTMPLYPEATRASLAGLPTLWVWELRRAADSTATGR